MDEIVKRLREFLNELNVNPAMKAAVKEGKCSRCKLTYSSQRGPLFVVTAITR